jgi:glycine/D-amino acid oxidase-like deaminating enzyme
VRPELSALGSTRHDLLVIGGGILGPCLAWDAALRGLKVALVERGELGGATSANSLRIIHGGLRYLVRGDLRRMRESIRERLALPADRTRPGRAPARRHPLRHSRLSQQNRSSPRAWPSTTSFPPAAIATSFQVGICPPDGRCPPSSWPPSVQASAPRPDAGEPCGFDALMSRPEQLIRAFVRSATEHGGLVANNALRRTFHQQRGAGPLSGNQGLSKRGLPGGRGRTIHPGCGPVDRRAAGGGVWTGRGFTGNASAHPRAEPGGGAPAG